MTITLNQLRYHSFQHLCSIKWRSEKHLSHHKRCHNLFSTVSKDWMEAKLLCERFLRLEHTRETNFVLYDILYFINGED